MSHFDESPESSLAQKPVSQSAENRLQQEATNQWRLRIIIDEKATSLTPGRICSPELSNILDTASRNMFDIEASNRVAAALNAKNCAIQDPQKAIEKASDVLAETGDKYNRFLHQREFSNLMDSFSGSFGGVGLSLVGGRETPDVANAVRNDNAPVATIDGKNVSVPDDGNGKLVAKVDSVIEGAPADKAGFRKGDVITKINGKDVRTLPLNAITDLIHDKQGTDVVIEAVRAGKKFERTMTRVEIDVPNISKPIDKGDNVTYIKISDFSRSDTDTKLRSAMESNPTAEGFVIDVRDNPGGLVIPTLRSTGLFIDRGTIMSSRERVDSPADHPMFKDIVYSFDKKSLIEQTTYSDGRKDPPVKRPRLPNVAHGRPVIVLTDGNTASAGEIFSGALHDAAGATTLGEDSFGKGIGQTIIPVDTDNGAVKVTQMRYYTPSGKWPGDAAKHKQPLVADRHVKNPENAEPGADNDLQLQAAVELAKQKIAEARRRR